MKVAALDLGSNTFLCLIAEVDSGRVQKIYSDSVEVVRLGQGLEESKSFHPDALARADACLNKFSKIIKEQQPSRILAMATSAARDAKNRNALFELGKKHNIPIEIIPGEQEALITYQGATSAVVGNKNTLVIDIGGGSTEFIFGTGAQLIAGESYDIGCVRLTERFISQQPTSDVEIDSATKFIRSYLEKAKAVAPTNFKIEEVLAVAGTPTALVAAELGIFDVEKIDGFQLTEEKLTDWLIKLTKASVTEKINMGIAAGRADVILIGVITLLESLKAFQQHSMTVSTRGVRYGVALEVARRPSNYYNS